MPAIERDACNSTVERVFVVATLHANTHTRLSEGHKHADIAIAFGADDFGLRLHINRTPARTAEERCPL